MYVNIPSELLAASSELEASSIDIISGSMDIGSSLTRYPVRWMVAEEKIIIILIITKFYRAQISTQVLRALLQRKTKKNIKQNKEMINIRTCR